jgi:hypothetical protein
VRSTFFQDRFDLVLLAEVLLAQVLNFSPLAAATSSALALIVSVNGLANWVKSKIRIRRLLKYSVIPSA